MTRACLPHNTTTVQHLGRTRASEISRANSRGSWGSLRGIPGRLDTPLYPGGDRALGGLKLIAPNPY